MEIDQLRALSRLKRSTEPKEKKQKRAQEIYEECVKNKSRFGAHAATGFLKSLNSLPEHVQPHQILPYRSMGKTESEAFEITISTRDCDERRSAVKEDIEALVYMDVIEATTASYVTRYISPECLVANRDLFQSLPMGTAVKLLYAASKNAKDPLVARRILEQLNDCEKLNKNENEWTNIPSLAFKCLPVLIRLQLDQRFRQGSSSAEFDVREEAELIDGFMGNDDYLLEFLNLLVEIKSFQQTEVGAGTALNLYRVFYQVCDRIGWDCSVFMDWLTSEPEAPRLFLKLCKLMAKEYVSFYAERGLKNSESIEKFKFRKPTSTNELTESHQNNDSSGEDHKTLQLKIDEKIGAYQNSFEICLTHFSTFGPIENDKMADNRTWLEVSCKQTEMIDAIVGILHDLKAELHTARDLLDYNADPLIAAFDRLPTLGIS